MSTGSEDLSGLFRCAEPDREFYEAWWGVSVNIFSERRSHQFSNLNVGGPSERGNMIDPE